MIMNEHIITCNLKVDQSAHLELRADLTLVVTLVLGGHRPAEYRIQNTEYRIQNTEYRIQ